MGLAKNIFNRWPRKMIRFVYQGIFPRIYARRHPVSRRRKEEEIQIIRVLFNG